MKIISAIVFSAISIATASAACQERCSTSSSRSTNSRCVYSCYPDEARTAKTNAANFAGALKRKGFGCSADSGEVICSKTKDFGDCDSHTWYTGKNCKLSGSVVNVLPGFYRTSDADFWSQWVVSELCPNTDNQIKK
ncbi:hypothetical protein BGW38_007557 [Lunasporangiospora selenospora]|uniref:Uncharacterized protein n=1 Tax=Lunasporangiospora selenospora TaxID=979761 RepID=A0A9P6G3N5_9FUNG|nr:hypothetical protein BGW38_007557 [Lunasporangiospora selenospora]